MSIPASQIVQVNPRLLQPGGTDLEFNGLLLSKSALIPSSQFVLPFPDPESVAAYFGMESDEYKAAAVYFMGYNNSFAKPRAFYIAARVPEDTAAFIRGASFGTIASITLATLKTVTDGTLTILLGAKTETINNLSFATANSLSEIAQIVQDAIQAAAGGDAAWATATVTYSSLHDAFTITAGDTGENSGVSYGVGDAAEALLLTQDAGAVLSPGLNAMTEQENMLAIQTITRNWVCFTTTWLVEQAEALEFAGWASAQGIEYLYLYWDNRKALLQPQNKTTIAAALVEANVGATAGVYDDLRYAAMIMGTAASIDWDRRQGVITFAFKSQEGLEANVVTGVNAQNLIAQNMNFMGDYATRNDNFIFMYPGCMFGKWTWIDTYLNAVWLKNALQVACMAGFEQTPRVPYNEEGYTLIKAWCQDPINRALHCGIIDPGVTLSESQKAELAREAGRDISTTLYTDGYVLQVEDPSPAIRQKRDTPRASLWFTYGGSVHKLVLSSTTVA